MKIRCGIIVGIVGLALPLMARAQDEVKVSGRVVDAAGKPVAAVEVAIMWTAHEGGTTPYQGATTNAEGRFTLPVSFRGRKQGLMAMDKDRKTGGLRLLEAKAADKPVEIKLVPLVRVKGRFFCKELDKRPSNVSIFIDSGSVLFFRASAADASFSFHLPPGDYRLRTSVRDFQRMEKTFTLRADMPEMDLKTLNVPASLLGKYVGKAPPAWHVTDARGVKKTVQLADYKGKWVLLEFWGYWCGPCVARSLPKLIDLYEVYKKDRDKFEILAFHNASAKDFTELDKKLERPRAKLWGGRPLPFPILLDATGQTLKDFGIESLPTTLLIDPEGKLVGRVDEVRMEAQLEERLPPLPMPLRIARRLDRMVVVYLDDFTLEEAVQSLARASRLPIRLDRDSLKKVGVAADKRVLIKIHGWLSPRSALHLVLEANGLTFDRDDKGLVVRGRQTGAMPAERLTETQRAAARWIERALDVKFSFEFKDKPLSEATQFFQRLTRVSFVLDPVVREAGRLDPKTPVSGSVKNLPLREALQKLLDPLGMTFVARDEVIVLTAKPKAIPDK